MKVGLYVRVSTEEQAKEGHSIPAQQKKLQQFAELNEYDYEFYSDEGYSAKDLNRPAATKLFDDIRNGSIKGIVIYKLDRLTRNVRNLYEIMELLDQYECKLISITESLDTSTASGRFFITMLGAMAQWERETIGERTFFGMKEAIIKGSVNGFGCYGYKRIDGKFIVDEHQADVVKRIFMMYSQGYGASRIALELNKDGIPSYATTTWDPSTILRIIKNKAYIGEYIVKFRDGEDHVNTDAFPPIVPLELFNEVQQIYSNNRRTHTRIDGTRLFSSVATCSICSGRITGTQSNFRGSVQKDWNRLRYRCNNITFKTCDTGSFNEEEIESAFIEYMDNFIKSLSSTTVNELSLKHENDKTKLYNELNRIKNIKQKNHIAFENDLIDINDYKNRIHELNLQESKISEQLNHCANVPKIFQLENQDFKFMWDLLDRDDKRKFILLYIKDILVHKPKMTDKRQPLVIKDIVFS